MDNFVNFLESYQKKPKIDYYDYFHLLNTININYQTNNYDHYFHGRYPVKYKKNAYLQDPYRIQEYSQININQDIPKRQETIDCRIESLDDLINLIDKYPYDPMIEYNIDLKNLHNIRSELLELNNMIGLTKLKSSILNQLDRKSTRLNSSH
jgi:hypothetical protein